MKPMKAGPTVSLSVLGTLELMIGRCLLVHVEPFTGGKLIRKRRYTASFQLALLSW